MRITKVLGPAVLLFTGLCLMAGATNASAVATGVCDEVPSTETHECHPGTEYLEGEVLTGNNEGKVVIKDRLNNRLECGKSEIKIKLGKVPSLNAVSTEIEKLTWEECKLGNGETCGTSVSPYPGEPAFPWSGALQWTTFGTTGPNGTQKVEKLTAKFKCGTKECKYVGAGAGTSITGNFFNANDTNKPVASARSVLSFKEVALNAGISCTGTVELTANYILASAGHDVYIANG